MSWTSFLREIERANRRAMREEARRQKEIQRQNEANRRAYEKQAKIDYLNCQQAKAELMTNEIIEQYERYKNIGSIIISKPQFFSFENYKKRYVELKFHYNKERPIKKEKSKLIKVPKERKIERIFTFLKNKRLSVEMKKKNLEEQELEEYNYELKKYEQEKEKTRKEFEIQEQNRKKEIEMHNNSIDEWRNNCQKHELGSLDKYFDELLNFFNVQVENNIISKTKYDLNDKALIYEVHLKKEYELFPCEGYRFYKQKDTIEPIATKKSTINTVLKQMIPNVVISILDLVFKNDELNLFNEVVVNVYYERKCCSSIKLSKDEYKGFDLTNEDNFYYVYDHYMRNYKVISTGVKPFDSIYIDLV